MCLRQADKSVWAHVVKSCKPDQEHPLTRRKAWYGVEGLQCPVVVQLGPGYHTGEDSGDRVQVPYLWETQGYFDIPLLRVWLRMLLGPLGCSGEAQSSAPSQNADKKKPSWRSPTGSADTWANHPHCDTCTPFALSHRIWVLRGCG